jgi:hypothetical protein
LAREFYLVDLAGKRRRRIVVEESDEAFAITFRKEYAMQFSTKIRDVRTALANRRTMRVAHRRLSAELASFRSPSERTELDQMLARYSTEETQEIRGILSRQDFERQRKAAEINGYRR